MNRHRSVPAIRLCPPHVAVLAPRTRHFVVAAAVLVVVFAWPLFDLLRFSLHSDLYSHVSLVPLTSLYLAYRRRARLAAIRVSPPHRPLATAASAFGAVLLGVVSWRVAAGPTLAETDFLALSAACFVLLFVALCAGLLGREVVRVLAFPLGFLAFMVPLPEVILEQIESWLQEGSAAVATLLFRLAGTTLFRDGLFFQLPDITLQIARECSGIHSSLALLITSTVAGYVFLRSPWHRLVFSAAVIPLAILRNGFRVFVIGELCVRIGPEMIDSPVHRHGGPIFFVLSLVPLMLLLSGLRVLERRPARLPHGAAVAPAIEL